ncbi:hypothetical protein IEQ34_015989 [Dendrobium chrysotoxum]|uniref:Transmembrane protein n=1 Tax=Dendrobium chrysotoxum TaxID=161865 RepID=A0AAV7GKH7_DENCH|nr:hypothetical protein IEQ34_015989 [Dendrobium chrysotoxum]
MASIMFYTFAFLVILILVHYQSMSCEGRHLIENNNKLCNRCLEKDSINPNNQDEMIDASVKIDVNGNNVDPVVNDDARPSVPGHNPGVGNSFHTKTINKNV